MPEETSEDRGSVPSGDPDRWGEALVGWVTREIEGTGSFPRGIEAWIDERLARRLLNPARAVFVAQLLFVAVVVAISWSQLPPGALAAWAAMLVASAAIRSGLPGWLARQGTGVRGCVAAFQWSVLISGLVWGGGIAFLGRGLPIERLFLILVALTGMVAASAVTLAPDPASFRRFEIPLVTGLVIGILWHGQTQVHLLGAGLMILFGVWVQTLLRQSHRALRHELTIAADLKHHDEKAGRERAFLIALLQSLPDAVVAMKRDGCVLALNRGFTETFGWEPEEVLGHDLFELAVPEEGRDEARREVRELFDAGGSVRDTRRRRKDGSLIQVRVLASPIAGLHDVVAILYSDISRLKETELALEHARAAAEQANRAKSEFLATMSHEIRTPMNAIIGMAELLAETDLSQTQREYVRIFTTAGDTLLTLINQILDLSKIEAGHFELDERPFSVWELVEHTVQLFAVPAHEKDVELTARIDPGVPRRLVGDADRLRQILVNLLGNGVKFTREGEVSLSVSRSTRPAEGEEGTDVVLRFAVADTGPGIPEDRMEAVFERFTQADSSTTREHGGSGLGLTISSALVALMHGEMGVRSRLGEGSTFYFTVRLKEAGPEVQGPKAPERLSFEGLRALVVDDNATNRLVLTEVLRGWGATPTTAAGGQEALAELRHARDSGQKYDLVLLDGRMPGIDGFEVAELVQKERGLAAATLMMLTSGGDQAAEIERARAAGIQAYLVKPVRRAELRETIGRLLSRSGSEAALPVGATGVSSAPLPRTAGAKILLVEDTEENQILIQAYLGGSPHSLRIVARGDEAVRTYTGDPSEYDLIFMDIQMQGMDGYEATRRIRSWEKSEGVPAVPIVALTAHALDDERRKTLEAGCDAHLTKPIRKDVFLSAVATHARPAPRPEG
ncbi:MAG: response regulator [Gemmatimonadota bacterium]